MDAPSKKRQKLAAALKRNVARRRQAALREQPTEPLETQAAGPISREPANDR